MTKRCPDCDCVMVRRDDGVLGARIECPDCGRFENVPEPEGRTYR